MRQKRIARLQGRFGLHPVQKKRFRPCTTQSDPRLPLAENELAKVPAPESPNQIWVADITYIPTKEGWLYLAGILDLCSRKVAGWNTSDSLDTANVVRAWQKAWKNTALLPGCCTIRIEAASMPARSSEDCWPRTKQEPQ